MLDIDHFKAVNDRFGHLTGDRVLVELADLLRQRIRSADLLVRWGGEEFLIMLAHTDLGQAIPLTEALRGIVESHVFPEIGRMTVSAGVTQYRGQESVDALLTRVDDLMYQAKGKGRNRVAHDGPQNGRLFET
jgi:diguanylate cyclase (GGDEF)-like protein